MVQFDLRAFSKKFPLKARFNFERIEKMLSKLGSPHLKLPPIIHVAGTNGKGSTIAFLRAIFESAGHKVHVYTSPHLIKFNERIIVSGKEIEDSYFNFLFQECEKYVQELEILTWFEVITVVALLAFAQNSSDILLLETGVGGRLDATNVIKSPLATAITSISYDHQDYLGKTLAEIAYAKAGIFKLGTPAFSVEQPKEVKDVLLNYAAHLSIPLFFENQDWNVQEDATGLTYCSYLQCPKIGLIGKHQIHNAGLALSIATFLRQPFNLKDQHLRTGIATATWKGRLQDLSSSFLAGYLYKGSEIWLDGAHNEGGAKALAETIQAWAPLPTYFIIGMLNHKDPYTFLIPFSKLAQGFCFIPIASSENHKIPDQLIKVVRHENSFAASSLDEGLKKIFQLSFGPIRVVISGSIYLAGDVLNMLEHKHEKTT
jgi:dihydrofolate synthase/folylpolyglutamate synthase